MNKLGFAAQSNCASKRKKEFSPRWKSSKTTEYGPDGRHLTTRITNSNGLEWVITKTYDVDGRVVKTASGNSGEPAAETLYTYDEAGRLQEIRDADEKGNLTSPENPASGRSSGELDDKQFETMNEALKMLFSRRRGTGKSLTYDSQGRVTEVRDRNWAADSVTTTSYNEHGDKSEERMTATNNLALPIDGVSDLPPGAGARGNQ